MDALQVQMDTIPYVIFHDATLQEMLKVRPTNLNDMNRITGVGEQKLER